MRKLTLGEIEVENGNLNHTLAHLLVGTANPNITEEELREGYWEHEGLPKPVGCEKE